MFNEVKKSIQWGEETLTLETGKVARQADGSVIATLGETSVMANVTFARKQKPGQDFFPLTVHYQEKYYAAGKVPGIDKDPPVRSVGAVGVIGAGYTGRHTIRMLRALDAEVG